jgi:two-component system, chemotaxis family, chemotaxis protein CheY
MAVEGLNVLIVDDHALVRQIVTEVLRSAGVTTLREAADANAAWDEIKIKVPDIAIIDLSMPHDGMQLLNRIRRDPTSPDRELPVIVLTGHSDRRRVTGARDGGATEIVAKPVAIATLLQKVAAVIDRPRPFVMERSFVGPDRRRRKGNADYSGPRRRANERQTVKGDFWEVD